MTIRSVKNSLGHKLIGTRYLKSIVCRTLVLLPPEIIKYVVKHCWFVGSMDDSLGFTLRGDELKKGECLIFLSDELLEQDEDQIRHTIIHEIGHVVLGHRNSIGIIQTKTEVRKQEKEAEEFVKKFFE